MSRIHTSIRFFDAVAVTESGDLTVSGNIVFHAGNATAARDALAIDQVDNTADINKPVSTAVQQALDLKANLGGSLLQDLNVRTLNVAQSILPSNQNVDIGSETARFRAIYVDEAYLSTNTLYLGDTPVMGTNQDTILIKADPNQSISVNTFGTGRTQLNSHRGVDIASSGINADVQIDALGTGSKVRMASQQSVDLTSPNVNVHGNLNVTGNLTISGSNIVVDAQTVQVKDNILTLNHGQVGSGVTAQYAGIAVDRGDAPVYQILFDEADDLFKVGMVGDLQTIASRNWVQNNYTSTTAMQSALDLKANAAALTGHVNNTSNPHNVTAAQVGAAPSTRTVSAGNGLTGGGDLSADRSFALGTPSTLTTTTTNAATSTSHTHAVTFPVTSVASKTGAVTLDKGDVGLGNVDNTTDLNKPVSTAVQTALSAKLDAAATAVDSDKLDGFEASQFLRADEATTFTGGTFTMHGGNNIGDSTQIRFKAGNDFGGIRFNYPVNDGGELEIFTGDNGSEPIVFNAHNTSGSSTTITNLLTLKPTGPEYQGNAVWHAGNFTPVDAVVVSRSITAGNGLSGGGDLSADRAISLGTPGTLTNSTTNNVTATSHTHAVTFPVTSVAGKTGAVAIVKGDVGLGNVDNTSDASKPVSTAVQTALNAKANIASPSFTGTPTAPTQDAANNSTRLATTAFVKTAVASLVNSAPETLDTLHELASALGNDPNFATTVSAQIGSKADVTAVTAHINNTSNPHSVTAAQVGAAPTGRNIVAGNGLSGGGTLAADRTITLGTPGTLSGSTTNAVQANSHTHALSANLTAWDTITPSDKVDVSALNALGLGVDVAPTISNLDTLRGTCFFGFNQNSTGTIGLPGTSYDAIGWQIEAKGQRNQYVSTMSSVLLHARIDDGSGWSSWVDISGGSDDAKADKTTSITAGNGLSGGGTLASDRTIWLGTPGTLSGSTTNAVQATSHTHALSNNLSAWDGLATSAKADAATSITAGNGLSGGGTLAATRTITLATPGTLSGSTTNAVTSSSHTHALSTNLSAWDGIATSAKADAATSITAGNGLSGGGTLAATRSIALGTPGTLSGTTTNNVTSTSHTHALSNNLSAWDAITPASKMDADSGTFTGDLIVGTATDGVSSTRTLEVRSQGYAVVKINGDYSNISGEPGGSGLVLSVDGPSVSGVVSYINSAGEDGVGGEYTGTTSNTMLIGTKFGALQFGTAGSVNATMSTAGNMTFTGSVSANSFSGDGSSLTGITASQVGAVGSSTSITAGNGLSGGGTLAATRTITLGTPSTLSGTTTNSVSSSSHTHALSNNLSAWDGLATSAKADSTTSITAGNGLSGGGNLSANRTITLGTPGTLSGSTTNAVQATSHTHALSTNLSAWDTITPGAKADAAHNHNTAYIGKATNEWQTSSDGQQRLHWTPGSHTHFKTGGDFFFLNVGHGSAFQITSAGHVYAAGNVTAYSDARLKTDIEPICDALNKIDQIRGVTYTRIENNTRETGVIAQEVQKVLPEAVLEGTDEDKTLSVAYGNLAGLLIEGIKELKADHQARISVLESEVSELKSLLQSALSKIEK